ncbi:MAG: hypothetical protein ACK4UJ_05970 [Leptonema sp. (in: bacteria)]
MKCRCNSLLTVLIVFLLASAISCNQICNLPKTFTSNSNFHPSCHNQPIPTHNDKKPEKDSRKNCCSIFDNILKKDLRNPIQLAFYKNHDYTQNFKIIFKLLIPTNRIIYSNHSPPIYLKFLILLI